MKGFSVADGLVLPLEAVTQTFAVLARKGAGKTYYAAVFCEELLKAGQVVVFVDPVGVGWGLRASADGKGPGLPIVVLGGDHGDIPLDPEAGEVVARMVFEERISVVLDLSLMRKGRQIQFMVGFAETLYHFNREALHLVLDEADAFAPQRILFKGTGEGGKDARPERLLGAIEDLVRRGRARGIGVTLLTQRAAVLNKNVMTQAGVLVALQTISPQDQAAVDEWAKIYGTPAEREALMSSLATLPVGTAWFWSPPWNLFQQARVRERETFDSSATPKVGQRVQQPKRLAEVDLEQLRGRFAETLAKAAAEDPAKLQARIRELEVQVERSGREVERRDRQLAAAPKAEDVRGLQGRVRELDAQVSKLDRQLAVARKPGLNSLGSSAVRALEAHGRAVRSLGQQLLDAGAEIEKLVAHAKQGDEVPDGHALPANREALPAAPRAPTAPKQTGNGDLSLGKCETAILGVLAQHLDGAGKGKLALLSGYRYSGGFRNALSSLRTAGLITGGNEDVMRITERGLSAVDGQYDDLPRGDALISYWLNHPSLGKAERSILKALIDRGPMDAASLAAVTGYEYSGGFRNALSTLRTAGLLIGRNTEAMSVNPDLVGG